MMAMRTYPAAANCNNSKSRSSTCKPNFDNVFHVYHVYKNIYNIYNVSNVHSNHVNHVYSDCISQLSSAHL